MKAKKISALLMAAAVLAGSVPAQAVFAEEAAQEAAETTAETKVPKYIFLFIGDGMSYPQVQTTNYYLNAIEDDGDDIQRQLQRLKFQNIFSCLLETE